MHFARLALIQAKIWTELAKAAVLDAVQNIDDCLELGQVVQPFLAKRPLVVGTTSVVPLVDFVALAVAEGILGIKYVESLLAERDL